MTLFGFDLWATALAFARVAALVMLMPGLGETQIPAMTRIAMAVLIALLVAPAAATAPDSVFAASGMVIQEILIGLALGATVRMIMSALATAGEIFGLETGLSFAQTADPTQDQQGQTMSAFLGLLGVALVFATDLHHTFILGMRASYDLFAIGAGVSIPDLTEMGVETFALAFRVGVQICAPLIVAGLVFRVGLGVLGRLAPTIQVFFVALPLSVLGGFFLLAFSLSAGMLVWLDALGRYAFGAR